MHDTYANVQLVFFCITIELSIETTATHIMQIFKVGKGLLRIFLATKSPDEGVITKQACKDESTVFFFLSQNVYIKRTFDLFF